MTDKPLTDMQEEALIALAELVEAQGPESRHEAASVHRKLLSNAIFTDDDDRARRLRRQATSAWGRVMAGLSEKGLVDRRWDERQAAYDYTITEAGTKMLVSMGD